MEEKKLTKVMNREFMVYFVSSQDNLGGYCEKFRTLKHLNDYMEQNSDFYIIKIEEMPGSPVYDKYYK